MSDDTGIAWTDATWNPVRGCSRVSEGCRNCYAERVASRFNGPGAPYEGLAKDGRWTGVVKVVDRVLDQPLRWQRPRRIFVNSMSDLFHEKLSNEEIAAVFGVMAAAPRHTFQVLTKRPERMRAWMEVQRSRWRSSGGTGPNVGAMLAFGATRSLISFEECAALGDLAWPLPNVWLGVSVENQATADERIPILLGTPAAVRFVSYEPALGPVDFSRFMWPVHEQWPSPYRSPNEARAAGATVTRHRQALVSAHSTFLDWIIGGGESGPGARPFDVAWARSTIKQCRAAGVACFVKQLGSRPFAIEGSTAAKSWVDFSGPIDDCGGIHPRDRKGGDPAEWPEDLRVREFPKVVP